MRRLTFAEARRVEQLKAKVERGELIVIDSTEADFWLNIFDMALQTNEALSLAWKRSPNPKTDIVELVKAGLDA